MSLGCWALWSIGTSLVSFRDTPAEADALRKDIERAKDFYANKVANSSLRFRVGEIPEGESDGVMGEN